MRAATCLFSTSIIGLSLFLSACGSEKSGSFETEDGEQGTYEIDQATGETTARIETDDGTAVMRSGKNVAIDLPNGFAVYPGSEVVSNTTFSQGDTKGALLTFESGAEPVELVEYYRKQAEAAGIEIELELNVNDGMMIGGSDKTGQSFTLNANREGSKTTAQLMVGKQLSK
ncbi:hypothetical protein AMC99_00867 [Altererythrobacter epoxidivorans]|uniref:Lipoprotein n=1 Tax=Altererythrobacter epoxidivorans TaxID=361183 RepID=A0A0M4MSL6_9SPHN|nr:hypothetical protein [Altererythrobacter epoxidivorans]ALE16170.1 hypothetical protein AMC99_00867 [Altererythrobacter epoxidivorans]